MSMVRKQFYITEEQDARLKRLAAARGVTEAELVRIALDGLTEVTYEPAEPVTTGQLRETAVEEYTVDKAMNIEAYMARTEFARTLSRRLDEDAWLTELAFIKERARSVPGSTVKFKREDAYDDERHFGVPG